MLLQNNGEGGLSSGQAVTVANSGGASGDAWSSVNGNVAWATARPGRAGERNYRADGATSYTNWTGYSFTEGAFRAYFYLTTLPTSSGILCLLGRTDSTGTRVGINAAGRLIHQTQGGGTTTAPASGTVPLNQWFRIEVQAKSGTNTTNGTQRVQLFIGDETVPIYSFTADGTINSNGGLNFNAFRIGRFSGSFTNGSLFWDDVVMQDSFAAIGPTAPFVYVPQGVTSGVWATTCIPQGKSTMLAATSGLREWTATLTGRTARSSLTSGLWGTTSSRSGKTTRRAGAAGLWRTASTRAGKTIRRSATSGLWRTASTRSGQSAMTSKVVASWATNTVATGRRGALATALGVWGTETAAVGRRMAQGLTSGAWRFMGWATGPQEDGPDRNAYTSSTVDFTPAAAALASAPPATATLDVPGAATATAVAVISTATLDTGAS